MCNKKSDLFGELMLGPYIVSDKDTEVIDWIHGDSNWMHGDTNEISVVNVRMSEYDIEYLIEHLMVHILNLIDGNPMGGSVSDIDGQEQLQNWRLINILIKSGAITQDDVKEKYFDICEVFQTDDNEVVGLFDRYIGIA